jgi:hypothetical protein
MISKVCHNRDSVINTKVVCDQLVSHLIIYIEKGGEFRGQAEQRNLEFCLYFGLFLGLREHGGIAAGGGGAVGAGAVTGESLGTAESTVGSELPW